MRRLLSSGVAVALVITACLLPRAQASSAFVAGTATATAQAVALAPRTGGFAYTVTGGSTVADYRGSLAQAETQSVDTGLIGTALTAQQCDGGPPPVKRSQLPQPLIAESDHGDVTKSHDEAGVAQHGFLAVGGHMTVAATTVPAATATFDGGDLVVPGLLAASGLASASGARLVPGQARLATAQATVGRLSLLGGTVVLDHLRWAADHRSGEGAGSHGSFTVGDVVVNGRSMPASGDALGTALAAVNKALAATGVHVTGPAVSKTSGGLSITPLSIGIDNSALGAAVLNPVLTAAEPVREAVVSALLGASCRFGSGLTVGDIVLSALNGTGALDLQLGGVSTGSDGTVYANPFGNADLGRSSVAIGTPTPTTAPAGRAPGASPGELPSGSRTAAVPAPAPQLAGRAQETSSCATTSRAHWPACSNGSALAVGLIGLAAVLGVGGADWLVARRRRRLPRLDLDL